MGFNDELTVFFEKHMTELTEQQRSRMTESFRALEQLECSVINCEYRAAGLIATLKDPYRRTLGGVDLFGVYFNDLEKVLNERRRLLKQIDELRDERTETLVDALRQAERKS